MAKISKKIIAVQLMLPFDSPTPEIKSESCTGYDVEKVVLFSGFRERRERELFLKKKFEIVSKLADSAHGIKWLNSEEELKEG